MKPAIPMVRDTDPIKQKFFDAIAAYLTQLSGQHKNAPPLRPLPTGASTAEVVQAVNALLQRLQ